MITYGKDYVYAVWSKPTMRPLYVDIVKKLAESSSDKRLKVGAILLKDDRIVATGYNGQLPGQPHEPLIIHDHDISTVHAEMNIISFCAKNGISTDGCILLVTHTPCQICTKLIIQSGIQKIFYIDDYKKEENPFLDLIRTEKIEEN